MSSDDHSGDQEYFSASGDWTISTELFAIHQLIVSVFIKKLYFYISFLKKYKVCVSICNTLCCFELLTCWWKEQR